jgi:hypothetical protein
MVKNSISLSSQNYGINAVIVEKREREREKEICPLGDRATLI